MTTVFTILALTVAAVLMLMVAVHVQSMRIDRMQSMLNAQAAYIHSLTPHIASMGNLLLKVHATTDTVAQVIDAKSQHPNS